MHRSCRRSLAGLAAGLMIAAPLSVATLAPADAAATPSKATIRVDFGLTFMGTPYFSKSYQVTNAPVGSGAELSGSDSEVVGSTPSGLPVPVALSVDVDPAAQTVTIKPTDNSQFFPVTDIKLDVADADLATFTPVSDDLVGEFACPVCRSGAALASAPRVQSSSDPVNTNVTRTVTGSAGHWVAQWHTDLGDAEGAAVFHYTLPQTQVSTPKTFGFGSVGKPTGQAEPGHTLTAPNLDLPAGASETFQWYRVTPVGGHSRVKVRPIARAQGKKYKLRHKDAGSRVFVRMRVSAPGYTSTTVDSKRKRIH